MRTSRERTRSNQNSTSRHAKSKSSGFYFWRGYSYNFFPLFLRMAVPFKAGSFDVSAVLAGGLGDLRSSTSIQYSAVLRKYCAFFDLDYDCQDRSYFSDSRIAHYLYAVGEEFQYHPSVC